MTKTKLSEGHGDAEDFDDDKKKVGEGRDVAEDDTTMLVLSSFHALWCTSVHLTPQLHPIVQFAELKSMSMF